MTPDKSKKLLIVKRGGLGDIMTLTAIIPLLSEKWYDHEIHVLTSRKGYGLFNNDPYVNAVFLFEDMKHRESILDTDYVCCYNLDPYSEELQKFVFKIRAEHKEGYARNGANKRVLLGKSSSLMHSFYSDMSYRLDPSTPSLCRLLAYVLELEIGDDLELKPLIYFSGDNRHPPIGDYVVISNGSALNFRSKRLPVKHIELLIKGTRKIDLKPILLVGPQDDFWQDRGKQLFGCHIIGYSTDIASVDNSHKAINLASLCNLLRCATGIITVDSFIMHLSCALDCRNIIVTFGPTMPQKIEWVSMLKVVRHELPCMPCLNWRGNPKSCSCECMTAFEPDNIILRLSLTENRSDNAK